MSQLEVAIRVRRGGFTLALDFSAPGPEGKPLAIVGPNGAGKTTALLALLGIVRPDEGRISLGGVALYHGAAGVDLPTEARGLAYVPQDYALFPHLTARENVAFALGCLTPAPPAPERQAGALALLDRLGVAALAERRPAALSGGERQRVALARALARAPRALLFDEPFAALDAGVRADVRRYLRAQLAALALPAVVVTHDRADVEALGADVLVLEAGRIIQRGSLPALAANPASEWVARFCAPA